MMEEKEKRVEGHKKEQSPKWKKLGHQVEAVQEQRKLNLTEKDTDRKILDRFWFHFHTSDLDLIPVSYSSAQIRLRLSLAICSSSHEDHIHAEGFGTAPIRTEAVIRPLLGKLQMLAQREACSKRKCRTTNPRQAR